MYELYELIEVLCKNEILEYRSIMELPSELESERYTMDLEESELEQILYDKYDINIDNFEYLIKDLLPLCEHAESELTSNWYRGFGKDGLWLIKKRSDDLLNKQSN